ncbi:FliI/YscN family ATPase [Kosakonia pseudosacchari]|uniref:FliI/YscN family ATPase n=1 Tax=Kosakonia pseudosacchari TaxID=1646340 RepID=UPI003D960EBB
MVSGGWQEELARWQQATQRQLEQAEPVKVIGSVTGISGIVLQCHLPGAHLGDLCLLPRTSGEPIMAEVIGFDSQEVSLAALDTLEGIKPGAEVYPLGLPHTIQVSPALKGGVLDGFGRALDGLGRAAFVDTLTARSVPVMHNATLATDRLCIETPLYSGLSSIDGLLTLGAGQRAGIFAGAGCGKTTLLAELARNIPCDTIVFCLTGERGRELREFMDRELDEALRQRTVLVCATSDRSSMERVRAAFTATAIAEGFRQQGESTLLIVDSLTRLARAQREIGLANGEPPGRNGFPPSVYALLSRLVERSGRTRQGTITALYSVLVEQDSMHDPIADEVRSLVDGHIILSRKLADQGHYPAIDVAASLSRVMNAITGTDQQAIATHIRQLMTAYADIEMLIRLGEYQTGSDPFTDYAVGVKPALDNILKQSLRAPRAPEITLNRLREVVENAPGPQGVL